MPARATKPVCYAHVFEGLWARRPETRCARGGRGTDAGHTADELTLQRKRHCTRLLTGSSRRSSLPSTVRWRNPRIASPFTTLSRIRGNSVLAQSGEFCAGARRTLEAGGGEICGTNAAARNTGPGSVRRSRLRRLREDHSRSERSCGPPYDGARGHLRSAWNHPGSFATMRRGTIERNSKETQIQIALTIEGHGRYEVSTGIRFFDHMLELFAHHGGFDLKLRARGDLDVDQHHTVEDVGIVLGQAFDKALGTKRGILRAGYFLMPMDETMGMAAVDFCGRTAVVVDTKVKARVVGDLQTELVDDFFEGFARGARASVHARVLYGRSSHHKIEALFKAFARALRVACSRDRRLARMLPSTKGLL